MGFIKLTIKVVANSFHLYLTCGYHSHIILEGRNSNFIRLWFNGCKKLLGNNVVLLFPSKSRPNPLSSHFHIRLVIFCLKVFTNYCTPHLESCLAIYLERIPKFCSLYLAKFSIESNDFPLFCKECSSFRLGFPNFVNFFLNLSK